MSRRRVLSLIVEDHPGVLERVASQVRRRGFNIEALSVGPVEAGRSRMTVTVDAGHAEVDQVAKQVEKLVEVIDVHDITDEPVVSRELIVAKLALSEPRREAAVARIVKAGGRVVDASNGHVIVEMTAETSQVESCVELLRPLGLTEFARSGPVAIARQRLTGVRE